MRGTRAWVVAAVAGVLAFVASYLFGHIPGLKPCGTSGGLSAIMAFEFARSPADIASLFGADPCRTALIGAQRTGLLLDGLWFIPTYTAFLMGAAWASRVAWRKWLLGALLIAGLSDEVEGIVMWSITNALPGTQGRIDALWPAVHLKFLLLAIATLGIGWALRRMRGWRKLPALVVAAAGAAALLELALGNVSAMMTAFSVGWFALLAFALWAVARPSAFAAP